MPTYFSLLEATILLTAVALNDVNGLFPTIETESGLLAQPHGL